MEINQAFTILRDAGGLRAARVITENTTNFSKINVWRMARKLRRGMPVAKIIGQKWFWGIKFYTNKHTLDPRPDTETIVGAVLNDLRGGAARILDLGTGTGCIIAAVAHTNKSVTGVGVDISRGARRVARRNMRDLGLAQRVQIRRGNFMRACDYGEKFDVIISNPPYIARGDVRVDDGALHDPARALFAADNGLAAYSAIAKNARDWIGANGKIYLEIGDGQMTDVRKIFESAGWTFIRAERDLGGIWRVMVFCYLSNEQ